MDHYGVFFLEADRFTASSLSSGWQVKGNAPGLSRRPCGRMTPVGTGHLSAGRQLRRRSAARRRDRRTHLGPGSRREDEGGIEDGGCRPGVLGDVDGARGLEEAVPGADDLGQASAVGGVPEGDRSGDDLDKDRAGVGMPPRRVPAPEVDTDAYHVRAMPEIDVDRAGTSAAASGVTIGSPDADGAGEGGVPAAAGLPPSVLNAIAAPAAVTAAATSAARRAGLTSLMGVLFLCCGRSGERPGPSRSRRDTFAHTYRRLKRLRPRGAGAVAGSV